MTCKCFATFVYFCYLRLKTDCVILFTEVAGPVLGLLINNTANGDQHTTRLCNFPVGLPKEIEEHTQTDLLTAVQSSNLKTKAPYI